MNYNKKLREIDVGAWGGVSIDEISIRDAETFNRYIAGDSTVHLGGAESFEDLKKFDFRMPKNEAYYIKKVRGEYTVSVDFRPHNKISGEIVIEDIKKDFDDIFKNSISMQNYKQMKITRILCVILEVFQPLL